MMRSSNHLRREIDLRRKVDRLQIETGDAHEGWGSYARRRNLADLERARNALSEIGGDLEWEFDGLEVYEGGRATLRRFQNLLTPLAQTLRWTARDILFVDGVPDGEATATDLAEPIFAGTFSASLGLRFSATLASEQLVFGEEPIFDRTVTRVMAIFRAASGDDERELLSSLTGLRQTALIGIRQLSERVAEAGRPAVIRWRGESLVTVAPREAQAVVDAITRATPTENDITIQAVLEGADLDSGSFHLIQARAEPERDKHYRGRSDVTAVSALRGIRLGARVRASLHVIVMDSPVLEQPKETYVLTDIESTDPEEHTDG